MKAQLRWTLVLASMFLGMFFFAEAAHATVLIAATGFQDTDDPNGVSTNVDVLAGVSLLDGVWSPGDVLPIGPVVFDHYATGTAEDYLDAISLEFDPGSYDKSDLTLRVYLQKGEYKSWWEHYELLPGIFNLAHQDADPGFPGSVDLLPSGEAPSNTIFGWVDVLFDANSDPLYELPHGYVGVTLRLWNCRVDAIELIPEPAMMLLLAAGGVGLIAWRRR